VFTKVNATYTLKFTAVKFTLTFLFYLVVGFTQAQYIDSLHNILNRGKGIDYRMESRVSFINNSLINVNGVRVGVIFGRKFKAGGGISWLNSKVTADFLTRDEQGIEYVNQKFLKFIYFCYYTDFVFYKTKHWMLSVPLQVGAGAAWFQYSETYRWGVRDKKYFLLLYEPGVTIQYKVFRWLGFGADIAYRFTMYNNKKIADKLNSPTYSFKFLFWPEQLWFELFPKNKLTQIFGPAEW